MSCLFKKKHADHAFRRRKIHRFAKYPTYKHIVEAICDQFFEEFNSKSSLSTTTIYKILKKAYSSRHVAGVSKTRKIECLRHFCSYHKNTILAAIEKKRRIPDYPILHPDEVEKWSLIKCIAKYLKPHREEFENTRTLIWQTCQQIVKNLRAESFVIRDKDVRDLVHRYKTILSWLMVEGNILMEDQESTDVSCHHTLPEAESLGKPE